jgi:hypothetical protein
MKPPYPCDDRTGGGDSTYNRSPDGLSTVSGVARTQAPRGDGCRSPPSLIPPTVSCTVPVPSVASTINRVSRSTMNKVPAALPTKAIAGAVARPVSVRLGRSNEPHDQRTGGTGARHNSVRACRGGTRGRREGGDGGHDTASFVAIALPLLPRWLPDSIAGPLFPLTPLLCCKATYLRSVFVRFRIVSRARSRDVLTTAGTVDGDGGLRRWAFGDDASDQAGLLRSPVTGHLRARRRASHPSGTTDSPAPGARHAARG